MQKSYYDTDARAVWEAAGQEWPDPIGWSAVDGQPPLDAVVELAFQFGRKSLDKALAEIENAMTAKSMLMIFVERGSIRVQATDVGEGYDFDFDGEGPPSKQIASALEAICFDGAPT